MPSLYHFLLLRRSPQLGLGFRQLHSPSLDITSPTFAIYGSNTGVGKTLVSAGLAISVLSNPKPSPNPSFLYVKPVQTGFPADSDARFVLRKATALFDRSPSSSSSSTLLASNHTINASPEAKDEVMGFYEEARVGRNEDGGEEAMLACKTLFGWREAVSAHLAAEREGLRVDDDSLREALGKCLLGFGEGKKKEGVWKVIETAGGIASPGPSGTLQCDLYRPFRFPVILVGDGHLGGISATVSAYESLKIRGYDVTAIILVDHGLSNEVPLISYLRNSVDVLVLPPIPEDPSNNLIDWFCESSEVFSSLQEKMLSAHVKRLQRLHDMPQKAGNIIWWPFTQHQLVPEQAVTVIDSRCGENFAVHKDCKNQDMIIPQFDACASWWTQGPDATLQMELAREMGYSAGRYGHVMFPENVHEPALRCAELLLEGVGKGWATRAYFSDNGSTAVEIALKMAFRKFSFDHGIHLDSHKGIMSHGHITIKVLALNGSYHGDTLGAMEAQAPSSFTSSLQQPWYSGRGLFLDPPTIFMSNETWTLSIPDALNAGHLKSEDMWFNSRDELFSRSRDSSAVAGSYAAYISNQLVQFSELSHSTHIGALIIEPVIQGAGGMHMIDPLFQRILVRECQIRKIPVIFDEVFAGFWRLGRESAAELLGCLPDIACFGKLMTGGVIPLAVTLTKEAIFEVFKGDSKLVALLHGHSYSAHAVGCTAAAKAIKWFKDPQANMNFEPEGKKLKELWDIKLVSNLSSHPAVQRVVSLGTLCAIELRTDASESGYASLFASSLIQRLRDDGVYLRPLGNVIYLMCGPCTSTHFCLQQLNKVQRRINELDKSRGRESQSHHSYASQES